MANAGVKSSEDKQFYFHGKVVWEWGVDHGAEAGDKRFERKSGGEVPVEYDSMPYDTSLMVQKAAVFAPIRAAVDGLDGLATTALETDANDPKGAIRSK